jgi:CheY-like chemotaxis protein
MKILLVEDTSLLVKMLKRRLSKMGADVFVCENGLEAVEQFENFSPDLILMDMHMPVMDGYAATKEIRDRGYSGKIAALTASVMSSDVPKAIQAGCDAFIAKPIQKDFEEQIKALMDAHTDD